MIRLLAQRDGVMGVVLFNLFLDGTWQYRDGKNAISITRVVDVIDYICQLTGSSAHVGIGGDFDGGFGVESIPAEMDTVADLWLIKGQLEARGYSEAAVHAILHGNMLRKLREGL
jgi:membrane dipeptidase